MRSCLNEEIVTTTAKILETMWNTLNLLVLAFVLHTQIQLCYSASSNTTFSDSDEFPECKGVGDAVEIGNVTDEYINEGSGLAISSINDKLFWIIEDSENDATVFGVHENGSTIVRVTLKNATNIDWEAITTAPCEKNSDERCIFVADVGDNCRKRENISIYKFDEPHINNLENRTDEIQNIKIKKGDWKLFHLTYPEERHNCESIVIDPRTRDLILFTKENCYHEYCVNDFCSKNTPSDDKCKVCINNTTSDDKCKVCINNTISDDKCKACINNKTSDHKCKVYSAPVDTPEDTTVELKDEKIVVHFPLDMDMLKNNYEQVPTDATISQDGNTLIVRTNSSASIYRNESSLTVLEMLRSHQPCVKDLHHQHQGEGVSLRPDGKEFYILSEGEQQPLCRYSLECGPNHC